MGALATFFTTIYLFIAGVFNQPCSAQPGGTEGAAIRRRGQRVSLR